MCVVLEVVLVSIVTPSHELPVFINTLSDRGR